MMDSWWQKIIQSELKSTNSYFYLPHSQLVSNKIVDETDRKCKYWGGRQQEPQSAFFKGHGIKNRFEANSMVLITSRGSRNSWKISEKKTISHYSGKILSLNRILWGDLMESLSQFGANNTANQHIVTDSNFQVANSMFFFISPHLYSLGGESDLKWICRFDLP